MKSTISSKGQITVPVEVREELGLYTGTPVVFEVREGGVLLRKGTLGDASLDSVYGMLAKLPNGVLARLDEMRGPRPGGPRARPARTRGRK
jgi:AbrB family looped-hinge helix DNA binding protein